MLMSSSLYAAVDGLTKLLAEHQSIGQILWARYTLSLPVLLATTPLAAWTGLFRTSNIKGQILRGITPLGISISMIVAVRFLPLADATVILFIGPILVVVFSGVMLGERVSVASWIGVLVGFAAVIVVARPGVSELSYYAIFPLIAAVFYALLQILTRRLGAMGERSETTLGWTLAVGVIVSTPLALLTWEPLSATGWLLMISLGLVFGFAQLLMIQAFQNAPASFLAPFSYSQIIAAILFGVIVFGELPDLWTFVGIAMIVGVGVQMLRGRTPKAG